MTVKSADLRDGERIEPTERRPASINQPLAVIIWAIACVTTWQLVASVTPGMAWYAQVGIGVGLQAIFTALERPMLRGKPNKVSGAVLGIDTFINAGGAFPYVLRMSATPTVQMVSTALDIAPQVSPIAALALSLVLGFLLAAAPEAVWRWRG